MKRLRKWFAKATLAMLAVLTLLFVLNIISGAVFLMAIVVTQVAAFAASAPQGALFLNAGLTPDQVTEFEEIIRGLREKNLEIPTLRGRVDSIQADLNLVRKSRLSSLANEPLRAGQFVSDDCAEYLGALVISGAERLGKLTLLEPSRREALLDRSRHVLNSQQRAALTTGDIPLPEAYGNQVVELVWKYGAARQYGTVYPLGAGTMKLPRLKTSPAFGLIAMSAPVTEKSPAMEFVTFDAKKWGGLIRVPSEIEYDAVAGFGQWLANYCSRELAKIEDTVYWVVDGTATYASLSGVTKQALDLGYVLQLAGTKTHVSDITLQNLRDLRSKVASAAHAGGAYYMNRTMEALLTTFNVAGNTPYILNVINGEPRLDGYPIRWVDVLPIYDTSVHASQLQILFGDARFMYLGTRAGISIATSTDVFFDTDEIAVRALERFTVGLMSDQALAVLQLAAA